LKTIKKRLNTFRDPWVAAPLKKTSVESAQEEAEFFPRPLGRGPIEEPAERLEVPMATEEELKKALKAFKKRLKLTRLDDESGLSRGGGKKSGITGITPPPGHPPGIWEELVKAGKLRREMAGTYSVVEGA
jgi:hypothetical protein